MSDYNDGLLPEPCLRMDTHFGDEYESVEFGDGTGYVKAAPTLARLGALYVELDELRDENAKLRELCVDMMWTIRHAHGYFKDDTHEMLMTYFRRRDGKPTHVGHSLTWDEEEYERRMEALGMEVN